MLTAAHALQDAIALTPTLPLLCDWPSRTPSPLRPGFQDAISSAPGLLDVASVHVLYAEPATRGLAGLFVFCTSTAREWAPSATGGCTPTYG